MTAPLFISLLALCFSVLSFWWIHARAGRLRLSLVPIFAGVWVLRGGRPELSLRLPLAIYNSGARARTVDGMRLLVPDWLGEVRFKWENFADAIDPNKGDELTTDFPAPYAIDPRRVEVRYVEFSYTFPGELPEARPTVFVLEAQLDGRADWEEVGRMTLHLGHMSHPDSFIAYRNTPTLCPGETDEGTTASWNRHVSRGRG